MNERRLIRIKTTYKLCGEEWLALEVLRVACVYAGGGSHPLGSTRHTSCYISWNPPILLTTLPIKINFFTHVTNSVVIAVPESDVGNPQVEDMLHRVTTWEVGGLEKMSMVTFLTCGSVTYKDGGVAVHEEAEDPYTEVNYRVHIKEDNVWSLFSLDREVFAEGEGFHLYAVLNVGREGWCALASDFHMVFHVLRNHNMSAERLMGQDSCDVKCSYRQDSLVPRVRPSLRHHPLHLRHPKHLRSLRLSMQKLNLMQCLVAGTEEARELCKSLNVFYLSECDSDANNGVGRCLIAGFDIIHRKHWAIGRNSPREEAVMVVHKEGEARNFLKALSLLLTTRDQSTRNEFLRNFTHINTIAWEEAGAILWGNFSLQELALQSASRLPIDYLVQHAPRKLCIKIWNRHNTS